MRAMNKRIAGGLILACGLIAGGAAVALADADAAPHPTEQGWGQHHGGMVMEFHALGLTEAQRGSMQSIVAAAHPEMEELTRKMRANSQQLRDASPDDKSYSQLVARVSQENGALAAKLITHRAKVYADCYALLAPIQKTRLAEVRAQRSHGMGEHGEGHWHHPPLDMPET